MKKGKKQTDFLNSESDKLLLSDVSSSMLTKKQLKNWMWKFVLEVEGSDNIIGLHVDSRFKQFLAENLIKAYYR